MSVLLVEFASNNPKRKKSAVRKKRRSGNLNSGAKQMQNNSALAEVKPDSGLSEPLPYDDAWNEAASRYARMHAADHDQWVEFTKTRLKVMRTRDARDFGPYLPLLLNLLAVAHEELHTENGAYDE